MLLQIDVLAKDGTWRDIGGENPLLMTLAAAGVAPDQTEAVRFRLPPTAAAPSCSVADGARRRGQAGGPAARRRRWVRRCVGLAAVMVKAVLVLEAVGWAAQLVGDSLQRRRRQDGGADDPGSGSGTDPADVLMAYLTGSKGEAQSSRPGDGRAHRRSTARSATWACSPWHTRGFGPQAVCAPLVASTLRPASKTHPHAVACPVRLVPLSPCPSRLIVAGGFEH
jgi:hypothetical protein